MSVVPAKRKRAKKACIPCHQRKRKCDGQLPCETCSTYEYDCKYLALTGTSGAGPVIGHNGLESEDCPTILTAKNLFGHSNGSPNPQKTGEADRSAVTTPAGISGNLEKHDGVSAVMTFPEVLGKALGSENPPRRHWYGYSFGNRQEETHSDPDSLSVLINEDDLAFFSDIFFSILAPIADFVDPKMYSQRCKNYYHKSGGDQPGFGAVAAGIAALGSSLSASKYSKESELVRYAKVILDDSASTRKITTDYIVAWGLRVFYLRATANPISCWIASCTTMHFIEIIGLHEEESIRRMTSSDNTNVLDYDEDRLRKIFWISWAGHIILSYECDRSFVQYQSVTSRAVNPDNGHVADQFVRMAQIVPTKNSPFRLKLQAQSPRDELVAHLKALHKLSADHLFLVATKADLAFCFYRRIFQLREGIPHDVVSLVTKIGDAAVDAAASLASQDHLLWNAIGSVFQYICVLLSIDTPTVSTHIATAFKALENIVEAVDTTLTREAVSVAQYLLSLNTAKKRKELSELESIAVDHASASQTQPDVVAGALPRDENWELDWGQYLFEPYFSMLESGARL